MGRASSVKSYSADKYDLVQIRNNMYTIRNFNKLTYDEIAEKIGVTKTQYFRAETGITKTISKELIHKIINYFNIPEDEFIVPREKESISSEFEIWLQNRDVSEPYLKRAWFQYIKDTQNK